MHGFLAELRRQRWDDHRYYHQSRINQTLHLVSAMSFLATYVIVFTSPVAAALIGWLIAMVTRQAGHFLFEPKDYDEVNQATHEHKESIKVGYNLRRKVVLLSIWALSPLVLWLDPTLFGIFPRSTGTGAFVRHVCQVWLAIGGGALVFRTVQLCLQQSVLTGVAWFAKILTDPFHDIKLYCRAPLHLLRGELLDPMEEVAHHA